METRLDAPVNQKMYDELGERWYSANDDPVALLRAESRKRNKWIAEEVRNAFAERQVRLLDVGCGAGFLSNELAREGLLVTGLDASESSLGIARMHGDPDRVAYQRGDAYNLPHEDESFEIICAMDLLEHISDPGQVINEIARVLKPHGLFFFHTFNRNLLSYLVIIKGVEWFVRNTPRNMHVLRLFIKPSELREMCGRSGLTLKVLRGFGPKAGHPAFWHMLLTGIVREDFEFEFTKSTLMGYIGFAVKERVDR